MRPNPANGRLEVDPGQLPEGWDCVRESLFRLSGGGQDGSEVHFGLCLRVSTLVVLRPGSTHSPAADAPGAGAGDDGDGSGGERESTVIAEARNHARRLRREIGTLGSG